MDRDRENEVEQKTLHSILFMNGLVNGVSFSLNQLFSGTYVPVRPYMHSRAERTGDVVGKCVPYFVMGYALMSKF